MNKENTQNSGLKAKEKVETQGSGLKTCGSDCACSSQNPKPLTHDSKPNTQNSKPKTHSLITVVFICFIVSLVTSVSVVYKYDKHFAQKIVTYDLKGFLDEQAKLRMADIIDDTQLRHNIQSVKEKLDQLPKNKVVIMRDVVLIGAQPVD